MHNKAQNSLSGNWFYFNEIKNIATPAVAVYPQRVRQNIARAVRAVNDPSRLRPHFKTAKCAEVCRMLMEGGVYQFKCATIAEAEVLATAGAPDVLLAYQPVGPDVHRLLKLKHIYPQTQFSCIVDDAEVVRALSNAAAEQKVAVDVYLDINVGMNRTGVLLPNAMALFEVINNLPFLALKGLHAYDGHIKNKDYEARKAACDAAFMPVLQFMKKMEEKGCVKPELIAGGSNTFFIHAGHNERRCSPGTFVYWDAGYLEAFPEQPFEPAAVLFSTVVSLPGAGIVTLDAGHKAIAAENVLENRMRFLEEPDAVIIGQSEEHLVVKVPPGHSHRVGDVWAFLPYHICPTIALYQSVLTIQDGKLAGEWLTVARNRKLRV